MGNGIDYPALPKSFLQHPASKAIALGVAIDAENAVILDRAGQGLLAARAYVDSRNSHLSTSLFKELSTL